MDKRGGAVGMDGVCMVQVENSNTVPTLEVVKPWHVLAVDKSGWGCGNGIVCYTTC